MYHKGHVSQIDVKNYPVTLEKTMLTENNLSIKPTKRFHENQEDGIKNRGH